MPDIVYRLDPDGTKAPPLPADAAEARERLLEGNRRFVNLFTEPQVVIHVAPSAIGIRSGGGALPQRPFASVLSCSDARVPVEMIFRCMGNELFVVRVAGNAPGAHCLGSLEYAAAAMAQSLRLTVVLGHTGCGAVTTAVDSYLDARRHPTKSDLKTVVDGILPAVCAADAALQKEYGRSARADANGRSALIESAAILNVALTAMSVRDALGSPVECGFFDFSSREVALTEPPADAEAYVELAGELAASEPIRDLLSS